MMAQFVKPKVKNISITQCIDNKWDMQSSLYISELEEKTLEKKIRWNKDWDTDSGQEKYLALYKNDNGMKVILNVRESYDDGITLDVLYVNGQKRVQRFFDEWTYETELKDLYTAILDSRGDYKANLPAKPKTYDNISKLVNPYYNKTNETPIKKRVLTARGKKNEKILNKIHWEYNCEILGE